MPSVDHLKQQIDDMRQRRNELNSRSNILQAKQQIATAKDVAATALGGIGGKNLSEDFQKLEDKVQLSNARSDARLNSADQKSGKALEDKLAALTRGPSVEDRLEALKKQMNHAAAVKLGAGLRFAPFQGRMPETRACIRAKAKAKLQAQRRGER